MAHQLYSLAAVARNKRWSRHWLTLAASESNAERGWHQVYGAHWTADGDCAVDVKPAPLATDNHVLLISTGSIVVIAGPSSSGIEQVPDNGYTSLAQADTQAEPQGTTSYIQQTQDLLTRARQLLEQAPVGDSVARLMHFELGKLLDLNHTRQHK